ncbi:hypothetical protein L6452_33379 [Arctium lappa]|uniref:Uncharacterized protein n=1 Tax=Arctium lappa TaxID=4217 RepID=A0ACB8YJH3_ARCLA|nr:hypothetical protein L6452_33379 [Arctium lappa]
MEKLITAKSKTVIWLIKYRAELYTIINPLITYERFCDKGVHLKEPKISSNWPQTRNHRLSSFKSHLFDFSSHLYIPNLFILIPNLFVSTFQEFSSFQFAVKRFPYIKSESRV